MKLSVQSSRMLLTEIKNVVNYKEKNYLMLSGNYQRTKSKKKSSKRNLFFTYHLKRILINLIVRIMRNLLFEECLHL